MTVPATKYWCKIEVIVPWTSTGQWRDLRIWLLDNVPTGDYEHLSQDSSTGWNNRVVAFRFEKDATMFALKWL